MAEGATKTTRTRRTKKTAEPAKGIFVGGVYARKGANALILSTLECCAVTSEYVGVSLVNPLGFNDKMRIPVAEADSGVPGWVYVGGGVALADALKAGV